MINTRPKYFLEFGKKYGKLTLKDKSSFSLFNYEKTSWLCDCGKEKSIFIINVLKGASRSCGRCSTILITTNRKYGKLRIKESGEFHPNSDKRPTWICDCGNESRAYVNHVLNGYSSSCGKCTIRPASYWRETKFKNLRMKEPKDYHLQSNKKTIWICDCGNETSLQINQVTNGHSVTCGKCNLLGIEYWEKEKFGKLRMKEPKIIHKNSHFKVDWVCDCGKENEITVSSVTSGRIKSCGKCHILGIEFWKKAKFGKLRMENPIETTKGSGQKVNWICDCGNIKNIAINVVTRKGGTHTCGKCSERAISWFIENEIIIRNLKTPIHQNQIPSRFLEIEEPILDKRKPFKTKCCACGSEYYPIWSNIRRGVSLTCGCSSYQISRGQIEINDYIKSLGIDCVMEYKISGMNYDMFVPSKNLLIEYNGLRWHSFDGAKKRDTSKYKKALELKYDFISIFEDEWIKDRFKIENILKSKLNVNKVVNLRPSLCDIRKIGANEINQFYFRYHYIGACKGKIHYGVFYDEKLISAMSFSTPTRQSKHSWELIRMASDCDFRVHGIWSKILKQFIEEYKPKSVVSFSDNRLFSGKVYEKIGFKFNKNLFPDYYWVKNNKRSHKSGLRKNKSEKLSGKTETELREAQGYRKIWDLGKKRWVLFIND